MLLPALEDPARGRRKLRYPLAVIISALSRGIATGERISRSRASKGERGTWQRRYWDMPFAMTTISRVISIMFISIRSSIGW